MSIHVRETSKGRRYDVKVRGADGRQHSKTFATKRAAVDYESRQRSAVNDGTFVAPRAGAMTVGELGRRWMATGAKRETTRSRDRSIVVGHIGPGLGDDTPISRLSRANCQALVDRWVAAGAAPRTVVRQAAVLRAMFQHAVDADLLVRNPAARLRLPGVEVVDRPQLSGADLERLADVLGGDQAVFMWCGAVLGLRWSETAGLTRSSLEVESGSVRVANQIDRDGRLVPPKTRSSVRTLSAPRWLFVALLQVVERSTDLNADPLVFTNTGGRGLSYPNWRSRVWQPATAAAGLPGLRYHDLRSIAASALVAAGVDLRTAMHRLGHSTPAMTLAVYARVADDRDRAAAEAVSARLRPGAAAG
ncbi:MAG TPA: site-specific integrase [Acidimicrobiales bacterium]|nr:site-specific integrase [Acidimicrobiales bacterium]